MNSKGIKIDKIQQITHYSVYGGAVFSIKITEIYTKFNCSELNPESNCIWHLDLYVKANVINTHLVKGNTLSRAKGDCGMGKPSKKMDRLAVLFEMEEQFLELYCICFSTFYINYYLLFWHYNTSELFCDLHGLLEERGEIDIKI